MRTICAIARLTLLEALRSKLLLTLAIFTAGVLLFSRFTMFLTAPEQAKIFQDLCLGMLSLFTCLLAVVLPIEQLQREQERNGLAAVLVKPISRYEFLAGKMLGFIFVLLLVTAALSLLVFVLVVSRDMLWNPDLPKACVLIFCQGLILASCSTVLGVVLSSNFLAMLCGVCVYLAGNMLEPLSELVEHASSMAIQVGALLLLYLLPHLQNLNIQDAVVLGESVGWAYVGSNVAYSGAYAFIVWLVAALAFNQKDF